MKENPNSDSDQEPFNKQLYLQNFENLDELAISTAEKVINRIPKNILELQTALNLKNFEKVSQISHSIAGVVGMFYALPSEKIAKQIEQLANEDNLENIEKLFIQLEHELKRLQLALIEFCKEKKLSN